MLTKNFKEEEFECKCGCGSRKIAPAIAMLCQLVRDAYKVPVKVTSGVRCTSHNKNVGGAEKSQHVPDLDGFGHAVDIQVEGVEPEEVYELLDNLYPNTLGLGLYNNWVHIDDRLLKAYRWDKSTK